MFIFKSNYKHLAPAPPVFHLVPGENLLHLVAGAGERILEAAGGFYGDHHGQPSHNNETIQITIQKHNKGVQNVT